MLSLVNGVHFFFFFYCVLRHLNGSHVYATVRYIYLCKHFIAICIGVYILHKYYIHILL